MIVETDASDIGYGWILKQKTHDKEQLVRYHSGILPGPQQNYSTIKKEILSIVLCISKFQDDLFLLQIDCKSAKAVLQKDVKNLVSKQIFVRWQAILSSFDFENEFIKGENNSPSDFPSRKFLQGKSAKHILCRFSQWARRTKAKVYKKNDDYKLVPTKNSFQSSPISHLYHTKLLSQNHPQNHLKIIISSNLQNTFFSPAIKLALPIFSSRLRSAKLWWFASP